MTPTENSVELDRARLEVIGATMRAAGVEFRGDLDARLIAGGRSNLTYKLSDGSVAWVMRTPPLSGRTPSAHDVAREHKVTAALSKAGFPVPRPVALCTDETQLGVPYAIAEFVEGDTIRLRSQLERCAPSTIAAVADELTRTLAALHQVDYVAVGLSQFGRPDDYAGRQLRRWRAQWEVVAPPDLISLGRTLSDRLGDRIPLQQATSVIHGDYRIDNTILDIPTPGSASCRVAAVVDWELSTLGDPVADVAMMCAYRHTAFDLIVGEPSAWASKLLPGPINLAEKYEAAGGVPLGNWEFHLALAYFKIAVIAAGIAYRAQSGSGSGPGFETAAESVWLYLQLGTDSISSAHVV